MHGVCPGREGMFKLQFDWYISCATNTSSIDYGPMLRVCSFRVIWIRISDPRLLRSWCIKLKEPMNLWLSQVHQLLWCPTIWVIWITNPDPDHPKWTQSLSSFEYGLHTYGSCNSLQKARLLFQFWDCFLIMSNASLLAFGFSGPSMSNSIGETSCLQGNYTL